MAVFTLTTDWGLKDHYSGAVKGKLLSLLPDAVIVDITHNVPPFDIQQAAFILKNVIPSFSSGTIHLIGVNTDASIEMPHILVRYHGQYFIGADNGVFALMFDEKPDLIIELDILQDSDYFTFSTRDVFVKAAVHLAEGREPEKLGNPRASLNEKLSFVPVVEGNVIRAKVIYVDAYENVFVNITQDFFRRVVGKRGFRIEFRNARYSIETISHSYSDVNEGDMLALFSSSGYLEIAMNRGKASGLLGLRQDDPVRITITD
jgi:S-adenosylmethionine hydrolase